MSIRIRLTIAYSALLVVILLIFGGIVASVLHWVLLDSIDRTLDRTVDEVIENIEGPRVDLTFPEMRPALNFVLPDLDIFRASNVFVQVWNTNNQLSSSSTNLGNYREPLDAAALTATQATRRDVVINGTPLRVLTRPVIIAGRILGRIQAAVTLTTVEEAQSRVVLVMLAAGIVALITSLFLGEALLARALRPIEVIAETASQIATGDDLSRRIPYDGPPDELGQLTQTFNDTLERLEQLFQAQRRFVADVSHELRTPLTVIQAGVDLIRRYGLDEDSLAAIDSESKRMVRLVGDLLLLARADAGELPLLKQELELDTLLLEVFERARVLSKDGPTVKLGRFEPVRIEGDPDRLKQLLLNLISNALKYTPPEGQITLALWPEGSEAVITVSDTGGGIPEEDLPHIFDRFYRVDEARDRKQGGAGLGLAIARWIAEAHGGQISAESQRGVGTTFIIRLPLAMSMRDTLPAVSLRRVRQNNGGQKTPVS